MSNKKQKIFIIRLGKLGDLLISSYIFKVIRENYQDAKTYLLTFSRNKELLKYNSDIDKIVYVKNPLQILIKIFLLKFKKFSLTIDLNDNESKTSLFILKNIRSENKLAFAYNKKYYGILTLAVEPIDKTKMHLLDRQVCLVKHFGLKVDEEEARPLIYIGDKEFTDIKEQLKNESKKFIAMNISAGAEIRMYMSKNWIKVIELLIKKYDQYKFILLATANDQKIVNEIISNFKPEIFITQKYFSFQHFASYIKLSSLLITPDTSAVHVASALGIPIIGLYPNVKWNYISFAPYKTKSKILISNIENINEINPEYVFNKIEEILKEV